MTPTENAEEATLPEKPLSRDELETKKLCLEIQDMERPFWKRPTYVLAALPTLLIVITLTVGLLNGFIQSKVTQLYSEKQGLEAQNKDLKVKRDALNLENEEMRKTFLKRQEYLIETEKVLQKLDYIVDKMADVNSSSKSAAQKTREQLEMRDELRSAMYQLTIITRESATR